MCMSMHTRSLWACAGIDIRGACACTECSNMCVLAVHAPLQHLRLRTGVYLFITISCLITNSCLDCRYTLATFDLSPPLSLARAPSQTPFPSLTTNYDKYSLLACSGEPYNFPFAPVFLTTTSPHHMQ